MADQPLHVVVDDGDSETVQVDPETGTVTETQADGGVVVHLDARRQNQNSDDDDWFKNLADDIDGVKLSVIVNDLIAGIKADDESRLGWLTNTARGLDLLGLKLESASADVATTGDGPVMSKVKNPLLAESCLKSWANAQAELLPADGPVKFKTEGRELAQADEQAELLESAVNHYLTVTATEYYPETSHMLLWDTIFRGSGFKKIYRCPRRRRVVSEKVDAKDLIVSDTSTNLRSCGRISHEIEMRPSMFKLMQMIGAYRKTTASQPNPTPSEVDSKIAAIQGTEAVHSRPEDKPFTIWETQCELDLDEFIPNTSKFKGEGIPLPYLVSIDKDNEELLSIRRDWDEDDEWCSRIRMYVKYPYIPGPGFYGTGLLNLLGNASAALTAAWREALDCGMFSNFPGGVIDKRLVRGNQGGNANTVFTMGPGEWMPVDAGGLPDLAKGLVPMPYRDVTSGLLTLIDKITEQSKSLGQGAEIPAGEGVQNVPVGTMMAQIEQATKIMAAAHKGMHQAQSEEIQMLVELFRRHPESLIKADSDSPIASWDNAQLEQALQNHKLVPVSDPNVPSHIHRVAKAIGLIQLLPIFPGMLDQGEVLRRVLGAMREDPDGLLNPNPQPQQPPMDEQAKMIDAMAKAKKVDADIAGKGTENAIKLQELQSDQAIHEMDMQKEQIIHSADAEKAVLESKKVGADVAATQGKLQQAEVDSRRKTGLGLVQASLDAHHKAQEHQLGVASHVQQAQKDAQDHALGVSGQQQEAQNSANQHKVEMHKATKPEPKPAKPKGKK